MLGEYDPVIVTLLAKDYESINFSKVLLNIVRTTIFWDPPYTEWLYGLPLPPGHTRHPIREYLSETEPGDRPLRGPDDWRLG